MVENGQGLDPLAVQQCALQSIVSMKVGIPYTHPSGGASLTL